MYLSICPSLCFSKGSGIIELDDLIAFAEETGALIIESSTIHNDVLMVTFTGDVDDTHDIAAADCALSIIDVDGDGSIGVMDFIIFAARLKAGYERDGECMLLLCCNNPVGLIVVLCSYFVESDSETTTTNDMPVVS